MHGIKVFTIADYCRASTGLRVGRTDLIPGGGYSRKQLNYLADTLEGKGVDQCTGSSVVLWRYEFIFNNPPVDASRVRKALPEGARMDRGLTSR